MKGAHFAEERRSTRAEKGQSDHIGARGGNFVPRLWLRGCKSKASGPTEIH